MALLNRKVNMDQLLAIHNAMKYPVAYIQGPPGTRRNKYDYQYNRYCIL